MGPTARSPGATPAVSVVVSTFNRAELLPAAIDRLVSQRTRIPYEVILVDNNSTDGTRAIIEEAARTHAHLVRAAFEPLQGVSNGRNKGIELSRAPVVAFTDDDVLVTPDWVEGIACAMREHPQAACVGGRVLPIWKTPPPPWLTRDHWSPLALLDYGDEPFYVHRERRLCLLTANVAYRRSVLDAVGWFSPDFPRCQDHELLLRLWRARLQGLYLPSLLVTCEVPAERLAWGYHRQWHTTRGRLVALMRDHDLEHPNDGERPGLMLFGSPATLYRQLVWNIGRAVEARARGRMPAAREAEAQARHLAAFIAMRARMWRREQRRVLPELFRFACAWVRRHRWRRVEHPSTPVPSSRAGASPPGLTRHDA